MKTKTKPLPTVKFAEREAREGWTPPGYTPEGKRIPNFSFPMARCIAYTPEGKICGVTPAPFLDLQRGGMVCAAHKPERGQS